MAELFQPKFVDLVRNNTTTTGTADFVVGAATMGFTSFTAACAVGDQFYYSAIGIDKPTEREVGRGTMLAGGVIQRDPIGGVRTSFSNGAKSIALIAAAEWFSQVQAGAAVPDRAALASAPGARSSLVLSEAGRDGIFSWTGGNQSALVTADPAQGVVVAPASDPKSPWEDRQSTQRVGQASQRSWPLCVSMALLPPARPPIWFGGGPTAAFRQQPRARTRLHAYVPSHNVSVRF